MAVTEHTASFDDDLEVRFREAGQGETTVLGSSFGGWVAAEMSTRAVPAGLSRLILLDAIGLEPQYARPVPATSAPSPDPTAAPQTPPGRVVIPDAGHLPASQAPEPTFAAIDDFLAGAIAAAGQTP